MNLAHYVTFYNLKKVLCDKASSSLVSGMKKVDILPENFTVLDVLPELDDHYDLILTSILSLEKFKHFFHRGLFIFINSTSDPSCETFEQFYEKVPCYTGTLFRNDFLSIKFPTEKLTLTEQVFIRDKPFRFLKKITESVSKIKGKKVIVEIGTSRHHFNHDISELNPESCSSCNDGHSTHFFANIDHAVIHSVDINPLCANTVVQNIGKKSKLFLYTNDAVEFLQDYAGREKTAKIDLFFLDAYDVGTFEYAENHLRAYEAIKSKLNENCIIAIDDTDVAFEKETGYGGKGSILIPKLLEDNFTLIYSGRQSVLIKLKDLEIK